MSEVKNCRKEQCMVRYVCSRPISFQHRIYFSTGTRAVALRAVQNVLLLPLLQIFLLHCYSSHVMWNCFQFWLLPAETEISKSWCSYKGLFVFRCPQEELSRRKSIMVWWGWEPPSINRNCTERLFDAWSFETRGMTSLCLMYVLQLRLIPGLSSTWLWTVNMPSISRTNEVTYEGKKPYRTTVLSIGSSGWKATGSDIWAKSTRRGPVWSSSPRRRGRNGNSQEPSLL